MDKRLLNPAAAWQMPEKPVDSAPTITKNPIQPLVQDAHGTLRFKENAIVRHLLDWAQPRGMGLNELSCLDFSDDDHQQFAQLIGYSLGGYGDLNVVDDEAYAVAANMSDGLDERDARIAAMGKKLADMSAAVDAMCKPMAILLEMHPDDLKA